MNFSINRNRPPNVVIYRSQKTIEAETICDVLEAAGLHYHRVAEPDEFPLETVTTFPRFYQPEAIYIREDEVEQARTILEGQPGLVPGPPPSQPKPVPWSDRPLPPPWTAVILGVTLAGAVALVVFLVGQNL